MISIIKKSDIVLIIFLCIFAFSFIFIFDFSKKNGTKVIVNVDGKIYKTLPIDNNTDLNILSKDGKVINVLKINNNKVNMEYATCKDGLCLKQGEIHNTNETIVCLPNKVVVEINNDENLFDAVVK